MRLAIGPQGHIRWAVESSNIHIYLYQGSGDETIYLPALTGDDDLEEQEVVM